MGGGGVNSLLEAVEETGELESTSTGFPERVQDVFGR